MLPAAMACARSSSISSTTAATCRRFTGPTIGGCDIGDLAVGLPGGEAKSAAVMGKGPLAQEEARSMLGLGPGEPPTLGRSLG